MRLRWLAVIAVVVGLPASASAHARSVSYSHIYATDAGATVQLKLRALDHNALGVYTRRAGLDDTSYLPGALTLHTRAGVCAVDAGSVTQLAAAQGWMRYEWRVRCAGPPVRVHSNLLVDIVAAHIHIGRFEPRGRAPVDYVFTEDERSAAVGAATGAGSWPRVMLRYGRLGVSHLLGGWDHLVFLFLLVLMAGSLRELIGVATGFTLGHSATLVMAVTGFASPNAALVEALIGLSIVLVAVENVWLGEGRRSFALPGVAVALTLACAVLAPAVAPALVGVAVFAAGYFGLLARADEPVRLRLIVAGLFGMIHGFGFAGAIAQVSSSTDHLAAALAGFNLGIEVAQLAVLALVWPLVAALRRRQQAHLWCVQAGSAVAAGLGLVWFLTRV